MTNGLKAVIEAASTPAAKLEPGQWVWAFEGSPKAVEGYLAAAPEFQNAKVDTFFISSAVDTAIRDIKAEQANGLIFGGGPRRGASYGSCLGLR